MATGGKDRDEKATRERARLYQARRDFHARGLARRRRDNIVAGIVGGVIVLAAVGSQVAYFTAGPGMPEPTSSSTPEPTSSSTPEPTPASTDVVDPSVAPTP